MWKNPIFINNNTTKKNLKKNNKSPNIYIYKYICINIYKKIYI